MFIHALLSYSLMALLFQAGAAPAAPDERRVSLTVPAAPWSLTLGGDGLALESRQTKPDGRSGYFLLSDEKNKLSVSAFIEPAVKCKTSRECRDMVLKAGNPMWESPQNLVLSEIGGVSYFEFLQPTFRGTAVRQQNMYAQFVVEGYWVDLHISKTLYEPREHELFERIVKSAKFEPKKGGAEGTTPEEASRRAAEAWLPLLDSGRYAESWDLLSAKIKGVVSKSQWEVGMEGFRKPLGKLKSRRPGNVIYIRSLQGHPGHEGVILRYESDYEKRETVEELVGVIRDEDGQWRVMMYDTPD